MRTIQFLASSQREVKRFSSLATFALAALGSFMPSAHAAEEFSQLIWTNDGVTYDDTAWGEVSVEYVGASDLLYYNLVVDGSWQIQNAPLMGYEGVGTSNKVALGFDFGSARTSSSRPFAYGSSITTTPLLAAPSVIGPTVAIDKLVSLDSGNPNVLLGAPPAPSALEGGGGTAYKGHKGFPNQPQGKGECVPGAVSNSLKWLNSQNSLGIPDGDLSIANMKTATGWGAKEWPPGSGKFVNGAWPYADPSRPAGDRKAWWENKDEYIKGKGWLITTTTTTSFQAAYDALGKGCDVELNVDGHTAAVVGMSPGTNGRWDIDVAHDPVQRNNAADPEKQRVTYNPATSKFSSGKWINGKKLEYFVIECVVPEPSSFIPFGIGLGSLVVYGLRNRRNKA